MQVNRLVLKNFRNYMEAEVNFAPGRNVILGQNAQGKTNLLEAIEYASRGKSSRTGSDLDLIKLGLDHASLALEIKSADYEETIEVAFQVRQQADAGARNSNRARLEKSIKINGVKKSTGRSLSGHLVCIGFKSSDLNLLRGGPKYRRQWLDELISILSRTYESISNKFQKAILQRNRLLKTIAERGRRMSVQDQDELRIWDQQVAVYGSQIIKQRILHLARILPAAERYQAKMSAKEEKLSLSYLMKGESASSSESDQDNQEQIRESNVFTGNEFAGTASSSRRDNLDFDQLLEIEENELASLLAEKLKRMRWEEIARKQTLSGPHRDDISFAINGLPATSFASQGQQRTLVLALKLAELSLVREHLDEPPVLLLDDVMAELDLARQGFLMSCVEDDMQTIITTTHVDGFKEEWLAGARFLSVESGEVIPSY